MNVRTICLAVLQFGEQTGYDIRKFLTEGPFSYFLDASFGAIYPALAKLEEDGLVTARDEFESGRPTRRVFEITSLGRDALTRALLTEMPAPDRHKSEFLLYASLIHTLPKKRAEAIVEARRSEIRQLLAAFEGMRGACDEPASQWILDYAVTMTRADLDFMEARGDEIAALAASDKLDAAE